MTSFTSFVCLKQRNGTWGGDREVNNKYKQVKLLCVRYQRMTDPFFVDIHCVTFYSLRDFESYFLFTQDEILLLHD